MRRRLVLRAGLALPSVFGAFALSGCFGGVTAPHVRWELQAEGAAAALRAIPTTVEASPTLSLVVEGVAAGDLLDGTAIVYSRVTGTRSQYQQASWTERPAARLARLVQRSLHERGAFRDVTLADSGVAPDLMLTLTLVEMYHDVPADEFRIELGAALVDWRRRRLVARRDWRVAEALASADAAGAVAGAGRALTRLLAEVVPWVEEAAIPAEARRPTIRRAGRAGSR